MCHNSTIALAEKPVAPPPLGMSDANVVILDGLTCWTAKKDNNGPGSGKMSGIS